MEMVVEDENEAGMETTVSSNSNDDGEFTDEVREGLARIRAKIGAETFYNRVQEFSRDLTVIVLRAFVEEREIRKKKQMLNGEEEKGRKDEEEDEPATKQRKCDSDKRSKCTDIVQPLNGGIRVLDALSTSGLRAIRFALEVPNVEQVLANDFSEKAFETIRQNVQLNGVQDRVRPVYSDAVDLMMEHRKYEKRFHAVDLDPYGSASGFLDSAVQAVVDGGLLMVTCTDTAILCGNTPEACYNKYGSVALRHKSCHEMALRILLQSIDSHANRHKRYIVPLLCVSVDFYIRCFVKVFSGAAAAKDSVTKLAHVFCCATCQSLDFQPLIRKSVNGPSVRFSANHFRSALIRCTDGEAAEDASSSNREGKAVGRCAHCDGTAIHTGGPIWVAPIHEAEFVQKLLKKVKEERELPPDARRLGTLARLEGMLSVVSEELPDVPLYYAHDQLANAVKCPAPKLSAIRSALLNAGFRCSISHCNAKAIKTDAPTTLLWDICREWVNKRDIKPTIMSSDLSSIRLLSKKIKFKVDFTPNPNAISSSEQSGFFRFLNRDLGTKIRARHSLSADDRENWPIFLKCERPKPPEQKSTSQPNPTPLHEKPFPKTPDHYWDVEYPTRDEQLQRGYMRVANSPLFKKKPTAKRRIL